MRQQFHPAPMRPGETLGEYRQLDGEALALRQDERDAQQRLGTLPASWIDRLYNRWRRWRLADRAPANLELLRRVRSISAATAAGLNPDANDTELCTLADLTARDMERRLGQREQITRATIAPAVSPWSVDWAERCSTLAAFAEAQHWLERRGVVHRVRGAIGPFLRRVCCARWWRRVLRKVHARAVESTARAIGLVHKRAGCYVSHDGLNRRTGQRVRNERALESVTAINEHGQAYTLAELAARGPANREIRRHELMTRIAGFELIAKDCDHEALFVTVTCPSRMHAYRTKGDGGVERNPKHDGTTPDEAQRHLSEQWKKCRSAADRAGLQWYGFRIAEPNHDGTPHWHFLLFFPKVAVPRGGGAAVRGGDGGCLADGEAPARSARASRAGAGFARSGCRVAVRLLRRYFLWQADPDERGARRHRVEVVKINWAKGSAAGYIAKYVAKNIDGYKVEKDLYGNDALTSSRRVDAWASTWRIRQFQQIGGAPVGVWRELRRLHPDQAQAAAGVAFMLDAVNVTSGAEKIDEAHDIEQRETAAHGWAAYTELQGGPRVPRRSLRVRLLREQTGEVGRYGELMAPRSIGVETTEIRLERVPAFGIVKAFDRRRTVLAEVESERCAWMIVPKGTEGAAALRLALPGGEAARPWSPVNNCTRPDLYQRHPAALFGPSIERTRKRGRWHAWDRGRSHPKETDHERNHPPPQPEDRRG